MAKVSKIDQVLSEILELGRASNRGIAASTGLGLKAVNFQIYTLRKRGLVSTEGPMEYNGPVWVRPTALATGEKDRKTPQTIKPNLVLSKLWRPSEDITNE